jgi:hypothetical protein
MPDDETPKEQPESAHSDDPQWRELTDEQLERMSQELSSERHASDSRDLVARVEAADTDQEVRKKEAKAELARIYGDPVSSDEDIDHPLTHRDELGLSEDDLTIEERRVRRAAHPSKSAGRRRGPRPEPPQRPSDD